MRASPFARQAGARSKSLCHRCPTLVFGNALKLGDHFAIATFISATRFAGASATKRPGPSYRGLSSRVVRVPDDNLTVILIGEALDGATRSRRMAARLLLDLLRNDPSAELSIGKQQIVEAKETAEVVTELRALIDQHLLR